MSQVTNNHSHGWRPQEQTDDHAHQLQRPGLRNEHAQVPAIVLQQRHLPHPLDPHPFNPELPQTLLPYPANNSASHLSNEQQHHITHARKQPQPGQRPHITQTLQARYSSSSPAQNMQPLSTDARGSPHSRKNPQTQSSQHDITTSARDDRHEHISLPHHKYRTPIKLGPYILKNYFDFHTNAHGYRFVPLSRGSLSNSLQPLETREASGAFCYLSLLG